MLKMNQGMGRFCRCAITATMLMTSLGLAGAGVPASGEGGTADAARSGAQTNANVRATKNTTGQDRQAISIVGRIQFADGTPAEDSIVFAQYGGEALTGPDGMFRLQLETGAATNSLQESEQIRLTALATRQGVTHVGTQVFSADDLAGEDKPVSIELVADGECEPEWIPTFRGSQGVPIQFPVSLPPRLRALTVFDDGLGDGPLLYAGFDSEVGPYTTHLARWTGEIWEPLGDVLEPVADSRSVLSMVVFDDGAGEALYLGGQFASVAGVGGTNGIARWNGRDWSSVGGGVNDTVGALAIVEDGTESGASLYVAGAFTTAAAASDSPIDANRIARWDGTQWHALGNGVDLQSGSAFIHAIAHDESEQSSGLSLYVAGQFDSAGGMPAGNIARWDGMAWSDLDGGMDDVIYALEMFDPNGNDEPVLVAGGAFTIAGGQPASRIAQWDGGAWSALGDGVTSGSAVHALHASSDEAPAVLYVGGDFDEIDGLPAGRLASWDGEAWSNVPDQGVAEGNVYTIDSLLVDGFGDELSLVIGGSFKSVGELTANSIALLTDGEWSTTFRPERQVNSKPLGMLVFDDGSGPALYVGGQFSMAGEVQANRIARWDGESWSDLAGGMSNSVLGLGVFDDGGGDGPQLYAAGRFIEAGEVNANRIARWDGQNWHPLGAGLGQYSFPPSIPHRVALTVFDDGLGGGPALYVGGPFATAGGIEVNGVARWDGQTWSSLGTGLEAVDPPFLMVNALEVFDDGTGPQLIVGGDFDSAGGTAVTNIAAWDGITWTPLGEGLGVLGTIYSVMDLMTFDDGSGPALYAAGSFTQSGEEGVQYVARWDGENWTQVGSGLSSGVLTLQVFDDGSGSGPQLYAGTFQAGFYRLENSTWVLLGQSDWFASNESLREVWTMAEFTADDRDQPELLVGGQFMASPSLDRHLSVYRGCPLPPSVPGDLNDDGVVNVFDLLILLEAWGECPPNVDYPADLNGDGQINVFDLLLLLESWG